MAGAVPAAITGSPTGLIGGKGGSSSKPNTQFNGDPRTQYSGFNPNPGQQGGLPPNWQEMLGQSAGQGQGATAQHQFPTFDKWGGPDGAKNFLAPDNAYKIRTNQPGDYNKMVGHMANNQSWSPGSYFGNTPMNSRYAQFGNMSGNSYGNKNPFGGGASMAGPQTMGVSLPGSQPGRPVDSVGSKGVPGGQRAPNMMGGKGG